MVGGARKLQEQSGASQARAHCTAEASVGVGCICACAMGGPGGPAGGDLRVGHGGLGKNGLHITVQCANVQCVFSANYLHIVGPQQTFDE